LGLARSHGEVVTNAPTRGRVLQAGSSWNRRWSRRRRTTRAASSACRTEPSRFDSTYAGTTVRSSPPHRSPRQGWKRSSAPIGRHACATFGADEPAA
jgi:hypothetical protein